MYDAHKGLGSLLFVVYLVILAAVWLLGRRNGRAPGWLVGVAHALLTIQVAMGVILLADDDYDAPWYHPALGLLALLAIGLTPVLRKRFGSLNGTLATLGVVAVLALAAMVAIETA